MKSSQRGASVGGVQKNHMFFFGELFLKIDEKYSSQQSDVLGSPVDVFCSKIDLDCQNVCRLIYNRILSTSDN